MRKVINSIIPVFFLIVIFIFCAGTAKDAALPIINDIKDVKNTGITKTIAKINGAWDDNAFRKMRFIALYGATMRALSKQEAGNYDVIKDLDGFLHREYTPKSSWKIDEYAENLNDLYDYAKAKDKDFLLIESPSSVLKGITRFPAGISNESDTNIDLFLENVQSRGIPFLDSRTLYPGLKHEEIFYKTDHHWAPEMSFKAFAATIDRLNEDYGYNLDPDGTFTDISNYKAYILEDSFLGSVGIRVGSDYAGRDDFRIYFPKFETDVTMKKYIKHKLIRSRRGTFWHSFINEKKLAPTFNNKYASLLYGGAIEAVITNHLNDNGLKCLLITDSFGRTFVQNISMCFETTVSINVSKNKYTYSVKDYIDNYDPDVILALPSGEYIWQMVPGFAGHPVS